MELIKHGINEVNEQEQLLIPRKVMMNMHLDFFQITSIDLHFSIPPQINDIRISTVSSPHDPTK